MKDRLAPCIHYICRGQCSKGFEAEQKGICQHCKKYQSRKGFKVIDCELSSHLWKHIEEDEDKRYDIDLSLLYFIVKRLSEHGLRDSNREGIFEVEVENEEVTKCVVRCIYDKNRDISIVFRKGLIVTAWLNDKNDLHNTLDETKYERR